MPREHLATRAGLAFEISGDREDFAGRQAQYNGLFCVYYSSNLQRLRSFHGSFSWAEEYQT